MREELARTAAAVVGLRITALAPRREVVEGSREMKDIRVDVLNVQTRKSSVNEC